MSVIGITFSFISPQNNVAAVTIATAVMIAKGTATEFSDRFAKAVLKLKDQLDNPKKRGDLRSALHKMTRQTRVKPPVQL